MKKSSIKVRLIAAFAVTIVLTLLTVGIAELGTVATGKKYKEVLDSNMACDQALLNARIKINTAARYLRDMALSGYTPNDEQIINANLDELVLALDAFEATYPLNDGKAAAYVKQVEDWDSIVPQIVSQIQAGRLAAATDMIRNQCTPALDVQATTAVALTKELNSLADQQVAAADKIFIIGLLIVVAIAAVCLVFTISMAVRLVKDITVPMKQTEIAVEGMSRGDFAHEMSYASNNEIGKMMEALRKSRDVLEGVISDVGRVTAEMADGNFDVGLTAEFPGSLAGIETSITNLVARMNDTLSNISTAADQVADGSGQVSDHAQALASGAAEQASSVEELSATISMIAGSARTNSQKAEQSKDSSLQAGAQIDVCSGLMTEMVEAMNHITQSSQEIGKIIKSIEDIAFQTNILALNAAVEAARAGVAGKGFAVVADEVRNLASKSAEASKNTASLIENSIRAVEDGSRIVQDVNEALQKTVGLAATAVKGMGEIAQAVDDETNAINQITVGIDQISAVVQINSATSQESAAASEELSSQAELMHQQLARFRLRGKSARPAPSYSDYAPAAPEEFVESGSKY